MLLIKRDPIGLLQRPSPQKISPLLSSADERQYTHNNPTVQLIDQFKSMLI